MNMCFKINKRWIIISTSLFIFGCSQTPSTPIDTDTSQEITIDDSAPARILIKGEMVWNKDTHTIQPCGSDESFWLALPKAFQQPVAELNLESAKSMYAEVFGYLTPTKSTLAEHYPAQFVVTEINIVATENPQRCAQKPISARAFGNEPFWSATYDEQQLSFTQMGEQPQQLTIKDSTPQKVKFDTGSLVINKQICHDSMSDSLYGSSSLLTVENKSYRGCSTLSNQTNVQSQGHYSQTLSDGTTITLTLHSDHTTQTRYSYSDGSADIRESGFWQPLKNGKIQTTNVSYQGQQLISVREFDLINDKLSTKNETINGNVYPLIGDGLQLDKQ